MGFFTKLFGKQDKQAYSKPIPRVRNIAMSMPPIPSHKRSNHMQIILQQRRTRIVSYDTTPVYVKRGWQKKENTYRGYYRTKHGAWQGEIVRRGDIYEVYIFNPPMAEINKHSRRSCFHQRTEGKWRINLAQKPKDGDISSIILCVEKIIYESYAKI